MDLITVNGELTAETSSKIAEFERQVKLIKKQEEELKKAILEEMEKKNIIKLDTPELAITYVAPTTSERLDTKTLREELPDIYDTYVKLSPVKASIRVRVKEVI